MRAVQIAETIIDDEEEMSLFLSSIDLTVEGVLAVRDAAQIHLVDSSPLMALNGPGTLAYQYGVLETRAQFVGPLWEVSSKGGIEGVFNPQKNIRLGYQTVDVACVRENDPSPRTAKGAGAERESAQNLFDYHGIAAPKFSSTAEQGAPFYCIMVDERGAVEVSRPVILSGAFSAFIMRAFVSYGSDLHEQTIAAIDNHRDQIDDFDVPVIRRKS